MKKEKVIVDICIIILLAIMCAFMDFSSIRAVEQTPVKESSATAKSAQEYFLQKLFYHNPSAEPSVFDEDNVDTEVTLTEQNEVVEPSTTIVDVLGMLSDLGFANDTDAYFTIIDYFGVEYNIILNTESTVGAFDPNKYVYFRVIGTLTDSTITASQIISLNEFDADNMANELYGFELPAG